MYLPPNISTGRNNNGTPLKYTVKARDAIHQTLLLNHQGGQQGSQQGSGSGDSLESNNRLRRHSSILKYGSSPLLNSINASQLSVESGSGNGSRSDAASLHSSASSQGLMDLDEQPKTKKKRLFGFNLKRTRSNSSTLSDSSDTQESITSSIASSTLLLEQQESLFSHQLTHNTTISSVSGAASLLGSYTGSRHLEIQLEDALPTDFKEIYSADTLIDTLPNGRPKFTQRDITDWQLNDIRSLLIRSELKKEWCEQLPSIRPVNGIHFKIQIIPLQASDEQIISTLVDSDIYKEANFHLNFKIKTLTYIVNTVRQKHLLMMKNYYQIDPQDNRHDDLLLLTPLFKHELRNIIENYLLNLGVESECRTNFKKNCVILKKQKLQMYNLSEDFDKNKNLLKAALINNSNYFSNLPNIDKSSIKLSRYEKLKIWNQVQTEIYSKLNLDWQPDNIG